MLFERFQLVRAICVLIDTWWNVNVHQELATLFRFRVLIDTWWNVNDL